MSHVETFGMRTKKSGSHEGTQQGSGINNIDEYNSGKLMHVHTEEFDEKAGVHYVEWATKLNGAQRPRSKHSSLSM